MKGLDTRLNENEKSCAVISKEHESEKTEVKNAKKNFGDLHKSCKNLESEAVSMKTKQDTLNMKLNGLEALSMRENLGRQLAQPCDTNLWAMKWVMK